MYDSQNLHILNNLIHYSFNIALKWINILFTNENALYLNNQIGINAHLLFTVLFKNKSLNVLSDIPKDGLKPLITKLTDIYCFNSYGNALFSLILLAFSSKYLDLELLKLLHI